MDEQNKENRETRERRKSNNNKTRKQRNAQRRHDGTAGAAATLKVLGLKFTEQQPKAVVKAIA